MADGSRPKEPPEPIAPEGGRSAKWAVIVVAFVTTALLVFVARVTMVQSTKQATGSGDVTDERFQAVAAAFRKQGVHVERDPNARNTVRIYLPGAMASGMTQQQARTVASETRGRLGGLAIVYIKTQAGDTIAKASPLGLE